MSKTEAFLLMRNIFCELGINWLDFEIFAKKLDKIGHRNIKRWYDTIENYQRSQKNHKGLIIGVEFQTKKLIVKWFQENSYVQVRDYHYFHHIQCRVQSTETKLTRGYRVLSTIANESRLPPKFRER